ncbi:MAG: nucleotidyltransferase domain-containing protein [Desulfosporosinus sp.]|nr:nucleotidyltransferase domain-containing protein [Desulfosporosinus sp.]
MSIETKILIRLNDLDEESKLRVLQLADTILEEKGLPPARDVLEIEDIKNAVLTYCTKYPIKHIGLFGSYARGEANEDSDIDLIVEFDNKVSLMKVIGLKARLEIDLRKKVDLVEPDNIEAKVAAAIAKDMVILYEKQ